MSQLDRLVEALLTCEGASYGSVDAFVAALAEASAERVGTKLGSIEAAALGGALADRLGFAFVAGYHAAVSRLVGASPHERMCLAATEERGGHPRAIETSLTRQDDGKVFLSGRKTFVTLVTVADAMVVIARAGDTSTDRPRLVAVKLPMSRAGLQITVRAPTPFAPEIPHGEVHFDGIEVEPDELLPGDGYDDYLKPFRTIEDLHVVSAAAGYLASVARRGSRGKQLMPRVIAVISAARALALESPLSPSVHLALTPLFEQTRTLYDEGLGALGSGHVEERARLERDRPLLTVAERVREKRLEAALRALGLEVEAPSAC